MLFFKRDVHSDGVFKCKTSPVRKPAARFSTHRCYLIKLKGIFSWKYSFDVLLPLVFLVWWILLDCYFLMMIISGCIKRYGLTAFASWIVLVREWLKGLNESLKVDLNSVSFVSEIIPMTPESAESLDDVVCLRSDSVFWSTVVSEYSFHPCIQGKHSLKAHKYNTLYRIFIISFICLFICIN